MTRSEFFYIKQYFARQLQERPDVVLGIGDDCALLDVAAQNTLAVTLDMLVAGVHFLPETDPRAIGHKALAVNLSDLAAMGAKPAWVTLAVSLPEPDEAWLEGFCQGFFGLANRFQVQLVGGDTTHGPLNVCVQAHGFVSRQEALRRDGARAGDIILVTGTPGDAGMRLAAARGEVTIPDDHDEYFRDRLERPMPRVAQGLDLCGLASAAIDVSDGLAQDLGHVLERSGVGARVFVDRLPRSDALKACSDESAVIAAILGGGDDYELCFTVPPRRLEQVHNIASAWDCGCTEIGVIETLPGLRCECQDGRPYRLQALGYDHFG